MEAGVPARLSPAEGRKFGLLVGGAFLALAAFFWWRHSQRPMMITGSLGTVLVVAGLLIPGYLGPVYRGWMKFALLLSKVTTPIFMSIVYFIVITPTGLLMRAFGRRPLPVPAQGGTAWVTRSADPPGADDMYRQF
ncbi:MAG: SxtJ family membrane protein [Gemmatimonadales bacterium]